MSRKEEWIELSEAAAIISANSGREITRNYVKLLAHRGYLATKRKDARQLYYLKSSVQNYVVGRRGRKSADAKPEDTPEEVRA